jgi:hypothetical protein
MIGISLDSAFTMKTIRASGIGVLAGFLLLACLVACGAKSDKDLILDLITQVGRRAEKADREALLSFCADDYQDFEGRDKAGTEEMLKDYLARFRGIVVHILSTRFDSLEGDQAEIQTEVALSSGAAQVFRKFLRFSTENYRFGLKLKRSDGRWKISYAQWQYVSLDELYPESMSLFKKIFPDF